MSKFLINRVDLGKRITGYEIYVSETKEFIGLTPKQVKDIFLLGEKVYGFKLNKENELELDKEDFHLNNIMVKSGIGTFKPLNVTDCIANIMYIVVGTTRTKDGNSYEVVSNRYARTTMAEEKIKILLEFTSVGGIYIDKSKKLHVCDGVEIIELDNKNIEPA